MDHQGSPYPKGFRFPGQCESVSQSVKSDSLQPHGSSIHGILQARILEWVAILFSRGSSQPRESNPDLLHCRWILYHLSHQGRQKWELVNGKGASIQNRVSYLPTSDFHSYSAYLLLEAPYWRLEHF